MERPMRLNLNLRRDSITSYSQNTPRRKVSFMERDSDKQLSQFDEIFKHDMEDTESVKTNIIQEGKINELVIIYHS